MSGSRIERHRILVKIEGADKNALVYLDGALAGRADKLKQMWLDAPEPELLDEVVCGSFTQPCRRSGVREIANAREFPGLGARRAAACRREPQTFLRLGRGGNLRRFGGDSRHQHNQVSPPVRPVLSLLDQKAVSSCTAAHPKGIHLVGDARPVEATHTSTRSTT